MCVFLYDQCVDWFIIFLLGVFEFIMEQVSLISLEDGEV